MNNSGYSNHNNKINKLTFLISNGKVLVLAGRAGGLGSGGGSSKVTFFEPLLVNVCFGKSVMLTGSVG